MHRLCFWRPVFERQFTAILFLIGIFLFYETNGKQMLYIYQNDREKYGFTENMYQNECMVGAVRYLHGHLITF